MQRTRPFVRRFSQRMCPVTCLMMRPAATARAPMTVLAAAAAPLRGATSLARGQIGFGLMMNKATQSFLTGLIRGKSSICAYCITCVGRTANWFYTYLLLLQILKPWVCSSFHRWALEIRGLVRIIGVSYGMCQCFIPSQLISCIVPFLT
jgi:hypothetical protein